MCVYTSISIHVCVCVYIYIYIYISHFPGGSDGIEFACKVDDPGLIPGSGEGNGNPPSTLAWRIPWTEEPIVHRIIKSQTQQSN